MEKLKIWSENDLEWVEPRREYIELTSITRQVPLEYAYGFTNETTEIYMDVATGLVVGDIPAFEKWIGRGADA